jgi:putative endonuclease
VECSNGALYTGWTDNIDARLQKHNDGKGAKYTRAFGPVSLVACWEFSSKSEAMKFEWQIKQLSRASKSKLIESTRHETFYGSVASAVSVC